MHKITEEIKNYYIENPEALETKRVIFWEYLEERTKQFNLDHLMKEAFEKMDRLWSLSTSYWVFPDMTDLDKLLDDIYKKNRDA